MNKNKKRLAVIGSIAVLASVTVFLCTSVIVPTYASPVVDNSSFFLGTDVNGNVFRCYNVSDESDPSKTGVAIAWHNDAKATPNELTIFDKVTGNDDHVDYTVLGLARGAFRYCDFKTINLPNTIEVIGEEAFAYCEYLKDITIPYGVTEIAASTFLDCRRLETVNYADSEGNKAFGNKNITKINDHAFTQCVALKDFYCPENVVYFGESCFQKCTSMINFYFPSTKRSGLAIDNYITVRPYAFADCSALTFVYFETNMKEIDNYAFVGCNTNLLFHYNNSSTPTNYTRVDTGVVQSHWRDKYTTSSNNEKYNFETEYQTIIADSSYPCLRYTLENKVVKLDGAQSRSTQITIIDSDEISQDGYYAIIYKFDTPNVTIPGCFDVSTGTLTIPNKLDGKKVKIIRRLAFANNNNIKKVVFNEDLRQIVNRAFYNSLQIKELDFSACTKLLEVSYEVFQSEKIYNNELEGLNLPDCLEFIGGYAFANFQKCNALHLPNKVRVIDDLAFYGLGRSITAENAAIDLVLPNTLNDADAKKANYKHLQLQSFKNEKYKYWFAIGKYAFREAKAIRTCKMQDATDAQAADMNYQCSLFSNVFHTASNLVSFRASKNLAYLGKDVFKLCSSLREVFLTTEKSDALTHDTPWCIGEDDGKYGGPLFYGTNAEVIMYIDGDAAPGNLEGDSMLVSSEASTQLSTRWNAETSGSYILDGDIKTNVTSGGSYEQNRTNLNRTTIPTYYEVDFASGVKYWNPSTKEFGTAPKNLADYDGIIAFVKNNSDEYTAARYYVNPNNTNCYDYIDLTAITGISDSTTHKLKIIGDEAFAISDTITGTNTNLSRTPGLYFILPDTITKIGERAFFRKTKDGGNGNGRFAVRVVTYKNTTTGKIISADGTEIEQSGEESFESYMASNKGGTDSARRGYCAIPAGVTFIGKACFYNNLFSTVTLGPNLAYFGHAAFYSHATGTDTTRTTVDSITFTSNAKFLNDGNKVIYYIGHGVNKKIAIAVANNATGDFTFASDTKAVGFLALANNSFTKITLGDNITSIYGYGFYGSRKLNEVTNLSHLRYIGSMKNADGSTPTDWDNDPSYTEVFEESMNKEYDIVDFRDYLYRPRAYQESAQGAFKDCYNLKKFDFTTMTELRKISHQAFYNCNGLIEMTGTKEYVYKNYNASTKKLTVDGISRDSNNQKVLDLSSCSNLRSIGKEAFAKCVNIKYVHIPDNRPSTATESNIYIGKDPEATKLDAGSIFESNSMKILIKEKVIYSHLTFGQAHNAAVHYPNGCFNNSNSRYYYVETINDIGTDDHTGTYYWTMRNGEYILFNSADTARTYFNQGVVEG